MKKRCFLKKKKKICIKLSLINLKSRVDHHWWDHMGHRRHRLTSDSCDLWRDKRVRLANLGRDFEQCLSSICNL